jgi:hypothetical protein
MMLAKLLFCVMTVHTISYCGPITILTQDPHKGVFRSLLNGLQQHEVAHNVNPGRLEDVYSTVLVIDGLDKLRYGINLKRLGHIQLLLAGPNVMIRSCDHNQILASPELDHYLVPSEWTKIAYVEDEPCLLHKISIWPTGVDTNYWKPWPLEKEKKVVVYWKTEPESFCLAVEELIAAKGFQVERITYGAYTQEQFRQTLNESLFAVFLSRSESQGIALAEAWSMNVPTFVWNPGEFYYAGKQYNPVSSCPFLTHAQGADWQKISELEKLIDSFDQIKLSFSPREWVINYMSDYASVNCLLEIIKNINV